MVTVVLTGWPLVQPPQHRGLGTLHRRWRYPVRRYHGGDETVPPSYDLPILPTLRSYRTKPLADSGWWYGGALAAHHQGLRVVAFLEGWVASAAPGPPAPDETADLRRDNAERARLVASAALLRRVAADLLTDIGDDDTAAITRPDPENEAAS